MSDELRNERKHKFKDSPLGRIPEEWEVVRLKGIGTLIDGDWILEKHYTNNGVKLLQVGDIGIGRFFDKSKIFVSYESARKLGCTFVKPKEDILISRMPNPIGRACLAPELPYAYIVAVDITIFKVKENVANRQCLVYVLNSQRFLEKIKRKSSGTTRQRISRKNLEQLYIPLPSLPEQRKIAGILETVDNSIEKTDKIIEKYKRIKQGLMQVLLTKGIVESDEKK